MCPKIEGGEMPRMLITWFTPIITWSEIKTVMSKHQFKEFIKWMGGQACKEEGVYVDDLRRYLGFNIIRGKR